MLCEKLASQKGRHVVRDKSQQSEVVSVVCHRVQVLGKVRGQVWVLAVVMGAGLQQHKSL